ncbi:MAG: 2,5-dioxovalerate dehydrogenase [Cytophagales bacterium]|nr:aldehyde dehydrogenase (NADP(+)) [Bacteroidota bacterium]MBS1980950.1 aldehyde dehydrogenase (NADP(+)) [Bacteroidota bacterium]WHZ08309.1 MAG: 2,5-dioxovalerate dehydrogenase [Cytophagales bacterium]
MNFKDATLPEIDAALREAHIAYLSYKNLGGKKKGEFLRTIADEIGALGNTLIQTAMRETNLPEARVISERGRTTGHCRMFAQLVEEGSWVEARIDSAQPNRTPLPRADLRKMLVPIGPVVVFGAANFPLAYSTAGGDTAAALAAGCPVIVKAHPAHAETSELVAEAIKKAISKTKMPQNIFQHFHGKSFEIGQALVKHPLTKAVGFTGSLAGGKALFDLANQRPEPIPVFAEMSSINPVYLLPESLGRNYDKTALMLASSITQGVGQFCTNPGLMIAVDDDGLKQYIKKLSEEILKTPAGTMLHQGIANNYHKRLAESLAQKGITIEAQATDAGSTMQGRPTVVSVAAKDFLKNPILAEEVFGPFSLIVKCEDVSEFNSIAVHQHGQLTSSIIGEEPEVKKHQNLLNLLKEKAGRLIINGVPTGVEVVPSQNHGGPYPATTDSRFTAVGPDSIKRFARPVSFQNFPDALLPDELKEQNPLNIWRMRDFEWTKK